MERSRNTVYKKTWLRASEVSVMLRGSLVNRCPINAGKVKQKQRYTWVKRVLKRLSYLNNFAKMLRDARFKQHRLNSKKIYNRKKYNIKKIED
jgi:coenzyme F420-reducing hydrogenase delta subunit